MPFHLVGWTQSQDSAILVPMTALLDQSLQVNGNDVIVPNDLTRVLGLYGQGVNIARAQLVSPSLRRMFNEEIYPVDVAALPADQLLINWMGYVPLLLDPGEPLEAWMAESGAGATRATVLAWIADALPVPVGGEQHTIRITASGTAVASAWTNMNLAFNDVLPSGTYAVVGASLQSATMQAFRLVFKGLAYRPGWVGQATIQSRVHDMSRNGNLGSWGEFENLTPPSVDVLCTAGDSAFQGVLDLVQLAGAR